MRKNRFLTRFALVVIAAVGAALVAGGVATAAQTPSPTPSPSPPPPTGPRATSTTLTTSPASPVGEGTAVTLNAEITVLPGIQPIQVGEPAGTVQFKDGDTDIGAAVPVTPNTAVPHPPTGTASTITSTLAAGSHQLTAVFTPSRGILPSTSPPVTFVVNATGVSQTRTRLRVFPAGPLPAGTPRLLLAWVAPPAAAGTIQFKDGNAALGAPVPVVNGFAFVITRGLTAVGAHPLTAMFTPANPAAFRPSTSNTVTVQVEGGDDSGGGNSPT